MLNNDILRRIRYTFDFEDAIMIKIFSLAELEVTRAQISDWLKKEEDENYQAINDKTFATFLNGLINLKRGKREGEQPEPEKSTKIHLTHKKGFASHRQKQVPAQKEHPQ